MTSTGPVRGAAPLGVPVSAPAGAARIGRALPGSTGLCIRGTLGRWPFLLTTVVVLCAPLEAAGQDSHILMPADTIERRLLEARFEILQRTGSRAQQDRTQRVTLVFPDSSVMLVKWAKSARGGGEFNNEPRYEIAAYEFQKLFLEERDFVVPPTVVRCFRLEWYRRVEPRARPTFAATSSVLVVLQYWVLGVTHRGVYDRGRFREDSAYARRLANLNVFTYLIRHNDANLGNFLISEDSANPRIFSVDNGVAFESAESSRGYEWRNLRIDRLPRGTVDRLRAVRHEDLERALGVLAQFEIRERRLVPTDPTENLDEHRGVRRKGPVLQLGLTAREIRGMHSRLEKLLERVESGKIEVF